MPPKKQKPKKQIKLNRPNLKPSPHVLDLKKIQEEKSQEAKTNSQIQEYFSENLVNNLSHKKIKNPGRYFSGPRPPKLKQNQAKNFRKLAEHYNKLLLESFNQRFEIKDETVKKQKPNIKKKQSSYKKYLAKLPEIKKLKPGLSFKLPQLKKPLFKFIKIHFKSALIFVLIALLLILPIKTYSYYLNLRQEKTKILSQTEKAFDHLKMAQLTSQANAWDLTQLELSMASENFAQASRSIEDIGGIIRGLNKALVFSPQYLETSDALLESSRLLTDASLYLVNSLNSFDSKNQSFIEKLIYLKEALNLIGPKISQANTLLKQADIGLLPDEYQSKVKSLINIMPVIENSLDNFLANKEIIFSLLGETNPKKYLIVFQNNHEIRATGGFIGSYALLDVNNGEVAGLEIPTGGSYDLRAGLSKYLISPRPLQIVNARWEFHDANWFFDFPTSARKLNWFLQESKGPSVDGVIAVNASSLASLLRIIGPITLADGQTVTSDDFIESLQKKVEFDYDKVSNRPKSVIAETGPMILEKIFKASPEKTLSIISALIKDLDNKNIQIYSEDPKTEQWLIKNNWAGQMQNTSRDYLAVVNTNINGKKTDQAVSDSLSLTTEFEADGEIVNKLKISRTHNGDINDPLTGQKNFNYLRIYVPLGSRLLDCQGFQPLPEEAYETVPEFYEPDQTLAEQEINKLIVSECGQMEIYEENGKTVFASWQQTEINQTSTVEIAYKLPFKLDLGIKDDSAFTKAVKNILNIPENYSYYSLYFQKQSGTEPLLKHHIINNSRLKEIWLYPENDGRAANQINFSQQINKDRFEAIILKK